MSTLDAIRIVAKNSLPKVNIKGSCPCPEH